VVRNAMETRGGYGRDRIGRGENVQEEGGNGLRGGRKEKDIATMVQLGLYIRSNLNCDCSRIVLTNYIGGWLMLAIQHRFIK
jgi:hypothetical protein